MFWLRPILFLSMMFALSGCMSWKRVPVYMISTTIKAKDTVRLQTMDGRKMRFRVIKVDDLALAGKDVRVLLGDIDWLERGKDDTLKVMGTAVVVVIGTAALVGIVAVVAFLIASPDLN